MNELTHNLTMDISSPATQLLPSEILIVDDTLENLRLLSSMLSIHGYSVRKATGGEMALKSVESLPPDLILLDILMPDLNGYEVCVQLKRNPQTARIPIIFLSALDDPLDKVRAFEVGGLDYLTKPFQVEEVLARIHSQLSLKAAREKILVLNDQLQEWVIEQNRKLNIASSRLLETSHCDPLTNLPNRVSFFKRLEQTHFLAKMDESYLFAVIYLDCDCFKAVNHAYGYQVGDELLKQLVEKIQEFIQPDDMLARLGGDKFAILLNKLANHSETTQLAEKILLSLEQSFQVQGYEILIITNIGIDYGQGDDDTSDSVLKNAEIAMYQSKKMKNRNYKVYTSLNDDT
ncbi:diguanylate cyclase (plasmid) [Acaryochloris sp. 'Moss Beach']|uniref:diguanylate cyclase domain-containing protein n=1 Tax=Acaryochloris sp. 'Moss Beach' TaxID=2740837 RepID=UPI001F1BE9DE|nr:diguanylate cyclase [Acaryochloris sp. 'Moss Beach']UJB72834.1 diguanylate cyclase [Acaryochloris sp. 'Moss Beach']